MRRKKGRQMSIGVNNQSGAAVDEAWVKEGVQALLREEGAAGEVSLALLPPERMRELNLRYRGQGYVPDELSFPGGEGLGEVLLCPSQILENAGEWNIPFKESFARSLVHGLLHLLGYSHEEGRAARQRFQERESLHLERLASWYIS